MTKIKSKTEAIIRDDFKEELKGYATREEMHSIKHELFDVVSSSTNKILAALVKMQDSNDRRLTRIEEKVF